MRYHIFVLLALVSIGLYRGLAPYNTKFKYRPKPLDPTPGYTYINCSDVGGVANLGMTRKDFSSMCETIGDPWFPLMHRGSTMLPIMVTIILSTIVVLFYIGEHDIWTMFHGIFILIFDIIIRFLCYKFFELMDLMIRSKLIPDFDSSDHVQLIIFFCVEMHRIRKLAKITNRYLIMVIECIPFIVCLNCLMLTIQYYHTEYEVICGFIFGTITMFIINTIN